MGLTPTPRSCFRLRADTPSGARQLPAALSGLKSTWKKPTRAELFRMMLMPLMLWRSLPMMNTDHCFDHWIAGGCWCGLRNHVVVTGCSIVWWLQIEEWVNSHCCRSWSSSMISLISHTWSYVIVTYCHYVFCCLLRTGMVLNASMSVGYVTDKIPSPLSDLAPLECIVYPVRHCEILREKHQNKGNHWSNRLSAIPGGSGAGGYMSRKLCRSDDVSWISNLQGRRHVCSHCTGQNLPRLLQVHVAMGQY